VRSNEVSCRISVVLDDSDARCLQGLMKLATLMVSIKDSCTQKRNAYLVRSILHVVKQNRKYTRSTITVLQYVCKWCTLCPDLPKWVVEVEGRERIRWIDYWAREVQEPPHTLENSAKVREMMPSIKRLVRGDSFPPGEAKFETNYIKERSLSLRGLTRRELIAALP